MTTHDQQPKTVDSAEGGRGRETSDSGIEERSSDRTADSPKASGVSTETAGSSSARSDPATAAAKSSELGTGPAEETTTPPGAGSGPATEMAGESTAGTESAIGVGDTPGKDSLFIQDELAELRSRWNEVQVGFVDDPRDCVHKADRLVSDVVEQLTAGFSQARTQLEEQWDRGEEVSTENLRLALKRYRDFFERLLAV